MRIVGREEFLKLPDGTVYSSYSSLGIIGGLYIKEETLDNDWWYQDCLSCVKSHDTNEFIDTMLKAEEDNKFDFDIDLACLNRDGLYEEDDKFLIYNKQDLGKLIDRLKGIYEKED